MQAAPKGSQINIRRAPERDLPSLEELASLNYNAIVISGSNTRAMDQQLWVEDLLTCIKWAYEKDIGLLGVCFGHQMIARAIAGLQAVGPTSTPEWGWSGLNFNESPLWDRCKSPFYSMSAHQDEVKELPEGWILTASSSRCRIQGMWNPGKVASFGIQFHPEKTVLETKWVIKRRRQDGIKPPSLLAEVPPSLETLYEQNQRIFTNFFLKLARNGQNKVVSRE